MEVNLGTAEELRLIFVSENLENEELVTYVAFLCQYKDVFAWTYAKMLGLDLSITIHSLNIKLDVRPH